MGSIATAATRRSGDLAAAVPEARSPIQPTATNVFALLGNRPPPAWVVPMPGVPLLPPGPWASPPPAEDVMEAQPVDPASMLAALDSTPLAAHHVVRHVSMRPTCVNLHPMWEDLMGPAQTGAMLDLRMLSAEQLDQLNDEALSLFLDALSEQETTIYFLPADSRRARWGILWRNKNKVSAVSALALQFYVRGATDMVRRILLSHPVDVARELHDVVPQLFTVDIVAEAMRLIIPELTRQTINWDMPEDRLAHALGNMVEAFLIVHSGAKPEYIEAWLTALLIKLEAAGFPMTTENLGCLAGAIFSGGSRYADWIRTRDEKEQYTVDKLSQLGIALGNFGYAVPWLPAILAVASVVAGMVVARLKPVRDLHDPVTHLEGKLRIRLLKLQIFRSEYELDKFLGWIEAVKRCNGVQ